MYIPFACIIPSIIKMFQCRFFLSLVASVLYFDLYITFALGAGYHLVQMKSLETATNCSPSIKVPAGGLLISHRYGPCSPLTQENSSHHLSQILSQDDSIVRSINSFKSHKNPTNDNGKLEVFDRNMGDGNFVVTVGFGTPKRDFTLIFDTGSDDTWIRCKPCEGKTCDFYNPLSSSTFKNGTTTCNSSCPFYMEYNDNSYSKGYYVRDTLTLTPSDVFPDFMFGCSQNNSHGSFGRAAGLLGVGQDGLNSLIPQTQQKFGKIFCYCLPASINSRGYLLFGEAAVETCHTNKFTRLDSEPGSSYYIVHLLGITIGNQTLNISSESRHILDSGTVITRLPRSVYSRLRLAFKASMSQYPVAPRSGILDTCYDLKKYKNATIPSMVMHYADSLDVDLNPLSVISTEEEKDSIVCLAFAPNKRESDTIIIGNHQQLNLNVFYNIPERKVSFGTGGCGK